MTPEEHDAIMRNIMKPVPYPTDYVPGEVTDTEAYMTMADAGITPEQVPDKKERAAYKKYLKAHQG